MEPVKTINYEPLTMSYSEEVVRSHIFFDTFLPQPSKLNRAPDGFKDSSGLLGILQ